MNQILKTDFVNENNDNNIKKDNTINNSIKRNKNTKFYLKLQFYFSLIFIVIIGITMIIKNIKLSNEEKFSDEILNNYNITRLYSNLSDNSPSQEKESSKEIVRKFSYIWDN